MNRFKLGFTIFAITFSTVLLEVLYTRVFSVVYFGQFAFLIISLALFGYGLSGVYLSFGPGRRAGSGGAGLDKYLVLFALAMPVVFKLTLTFPVDFLHLFRPFGNFLLLLLNFSLLLVLFFLSGVALALIFSQNAERIGRLYCIDLIGASLGSLAIIPLISPLGPSRMLLLLFLLISLAWFFSSPAPRRRRLAGLGLLLAVFAGLFHWDALLFPIVPKLVTLKRFYNVQLKNKRIEFSRWSPIDKIDVAPWPFKPPQKVIWINGGTMQSFLRQFNGDLNRLPAVGWDMQTIPYKMARPGAALIIGSAGGFEVLCALSHHFKNIVAVEMDPVICSMLKKEYADYTGRIFDLPQVVLLADEGRSVLKRSRKSFDVIQMVNSHNADFLLSGALSISETYIYTVESFKDYWQHLNKGGFLHIVHWNGERLFATALQALRELGVVQPEKKFYIVQWPKAFNVFYLKKGDIDQQDLNILKQVAEDRLVVYSPFLQRDNFYYQLLVKGAEVIRQSSVNLAPVYDSSPYFNQPNKIGQLRFRNVLMKGLSKGVVEASLLYSNSIYLSIFGLSLLFSLATVFLPLWRRGPKMARPSLIVYFSLIGLAFIMVEIIFIKIFQLFLGSPAVSISLIIFSLLVSSGIGSLLSSFLRQRVGGKMIPLFAAWLALLLLLDARFLFPLLNATISLPLLERSLFAFLLIFLHGFPMGCFFPFGINVLGTIERRAIGWAWGANAMATVLGSILTVILSINWGFPLVLAMAAIFYLLAGLLVLLGRFSQPEKTSR